MSDHCYHTSITIVLLHEFHPLLQTPPRVIRLQLRITGSASALTYVVHLPIRSGAEVCMINNCHVTCTANNLHLPRIRPQSQLSTSQARGAAASCRRASTRRSDTDLHKQRTTEPDFRIRRRGKVTFLTHRNATQRTQRVYEVSRECWDCR